jgi:hypothetical protein
MLLVDDFLCNYVLPSLHQGSKGRYHVCGDAYQGEVDEQKGRVLHYPQNALVLQAIQQTGGSSLDEVVEEVSSEHQGGVVSVERVEVLLGDEVGRMVDVLEEHVVFVGHGHEGPWN